MTGRSCFARGKNRDNFRLWNVEGVCVKKEDCPAKRVALTQWGRLGSCDGERFRKMCCPLLESGEENAVLN